jgi:amino acid adenylation domain-containing protein
MTSEHKPTLYHWFAESARRCPDRPALEVPDRVLTYDELLCSAVGLATRIVETHGRPPSRIALLSARTAAAYVGYLAIHRLGAVAVPLNPDHPRRRNLDIARRAGIDLAIVEPAVADLFATVPEASRPTVLTLGDDAANRAGAAPEAGASLPVPVDPDRLAYIVFTSGSTGEPKGVPIRHRNLSAYLSYNIGRYQVGPGSRASQVFGLNFDASVHDMFVTWGAGGTLVVPGDSEIYYPVEFALRRELTHWHSVPSLITLAQHVGDLRPGVLTGLRHSLFGAEPVAGKHAALWRSVAPESAIHNLYGPTETTITCTAHTLTGESAAWRLGANGTVPIGAPHPSVEAVVLDEAGCPAEEGELCLRGAQRFDGYLDPAHNAGRFVRFEYGHGPAVPHESDGSPPVAHWYRTGDRARWEEGNLVHYGRLDHQVKVRGHRVEIGDVEAALRGHPAVVEAAVIAVLRAGQTQLAAGYSGTRLDHPEFFQWLNERVPGYMIPSPIRYFERLPLNENGKIDRRRLTELLA